MPFYQLLIERYTNLNQQVKCFSHFFLLMAMYTVLLWLVPTQRWFFGISLFLSGWFSWTFFEYVLHRFWMHDKEKGEDSPMAQRHHHHHTHPTDIKVTATQRSLLLLIVLALISLSLWFMIYFLLVAGFVFGFAGYTMMHWVLHQRWSARLFPRLQKFHIYHHCKYPNTCYGVSVCWWDLWFKTVPPGEPVLLKRIIDFYFEPQPRNNRQLAIGKRF